MGPAGFVNCKGALYCTSAPNQAANAWSPSSSADTDTAAVAPNIAATATTIGVAYRQDGGHEASVAVASVAVAPIAAPIAAPMSIAASTDDNSSTVAIAVPNAASANDDSSTSVGTYMPTFSGPPR